VSAGKFLDQERARAILERALSTGRFAPAYLFHGPPGTGKEEAALAFAQALNCTAWRAGALPDLFAPAPAPTPHESGVDQARLGGCGSCGSCLRIGRYVHPDVIVRLPLPRPRDGEAADPGEALRFKAEHPWRDPDLQGGNLSIGIEDVRAVLRGLGYPPVEAQWRVILFREADRMSEEAQNALLKSLEEPPAHTLFILTTAQPEALLPTVRSRCRSVPFGPLPVEVISDWLREQGVPAGSGPDPARLARGSLKRALRILEAGVPGRSEALEWLEEAASGRRLRALERASELVFRSAGDAWDEARAVLDELLSLIRDLAAIQAGEKTLLNPDFADRLERIARGLPPSAVMEALEGVTTARGEVDGFVNLALTYATLSEALGVLAADGAAASGARSR
jgi:DNA polymerase-3 subunit delta'